MKIKINWKPSIVDLGDITVEGYCNDFGTDNLKEALTLEIGQDAFFLVEFAGVEVESAHEIQETGS